MLKRKLLTLFLGSLVSISLIASWFVFADGEELIAFFGMALTIGLVAIPAILLYGIPVSFLSDKITKSFSNYQRIGWSLVIHVFFGISFVFIAGLLFETKMLLTDFSRFWQYYEFIFIASVFTAICFWIVDQGIKYCRLIKNTN